MFAQAFPDEDLTPRQKALLITVHQHPGATQSRIAELIALDRNSFAEMIARMTAKGVRRTRSAEDARAYALEITEAGLDLLMRVLPRDAQVEAQQAGAAAGGTAAGVPAMFADDGGGGGG